MRSWAVDAKRGEYVRPGLRRLCLITDFKGKMIQDDRETV